MIVVYTIILLLFYVLFLIHVNRKEYMRGSASYAIKFNNKGNIKGTVNQWILRILNDQGLVLKTHYNADPQNLENFNTATINFTLEGGDLERITSRNTIEIYYNEVKPSNKLASVTFMYDISDSHITLESLLPVDCSTVDFDKCEAGSVPGCKWDMGQDKCLSENTPTQAPVSSGTTASGTPPPASPPASPPAPCPTTHFRNSLGICQEIGNPCQVGYTRNSQGKCVDPDGCEYPLMFNDGSCE